MNKQTIKRSQIEEWDIDRLMAYEHNAKLHPDSHVDQIANSIEEFTFLDPVAVDEKGELLEGHGRLLAAKKRGDATIPVIQVTGLTEAQKVAYRLTHNKLTMNTGFDPELLKIDFEFLQDEGFDLDLTGFGELELSFLDEDQEEDGSGEGGNDDDFEPPEKIESRVKPGEIWQLGRHKIACGDSTIESNVRALLGDRFGDVGMVWADPPYGMNLNTNNKRGTKDTYNGVTDKNRKNYPPIIGDNIDFNPTHFLTMFSYCQEQFWWGADYYAEYLPAKNDGSWLVWDKRAGIEEIEFSLSSFELCWSKTKHRRDVIRIKWFGIQGTEQEDVKTRIHPAQKPVTLVKWCFGKYGSSDDLIFDPFLGSAPSIIAAQQMEGDRTVYGFELSVDYCEVICQRFFNLTGIEPVLVGHLDLDF
jgi:DNA modification methylase